MSKREGSVEVRGGGRELELRARGAASPSTKTKALAAAYFPHPVAQAVSSALRRFTSVFGMGTGGSTSL